MVKNDFFHPSFSKADLQEQQLAREVEDLKQQLNDHTTTIELLEGELQEPKKHLALHHQLEHEPELAAAVEDEDPKMIHGETGVESGHE
jgi:hypothetical protein